ncbi:MAG: peptidylprolyl isomerase [Oscillospiraceae bacterium]|nr:peptidylprolyl isomerase [Oscillospiraceae bacterium]
MANNEYDPQEDSTLHEELKKKGKVTSNAKKNNTWMYIAGGVLLVGIVFAAFFAVKNGMLDLGISLGAAEEAVLTMKGTTVNKTEGQAYYDYLKEESEAEGNDVTSPEAIASLKDEALRGLAKNAIAQAKVKDFGFETVTDEEKLEAEEEITVYYNEAIDLYTPEFQNEEGTLTTEEMRAEAIAYFDSYGYTLDAMKQQAVANIPYEKLRHWITGDIEVTDAEVDEYNESLASAELATYDGSVGNYEIYALLFGQQWHFRPAGYRSVHHILLSPPEDIQAKMDAANAELTTIDTDLSALTSELAALTTELAALNSPAAAEDGTVPPVDEAAVTAKQAEIDGKQEQIDAKQAESTAKQAEIDELWVDARAALEPTFAEINEKLAAGTSFDELIAEYGSDPGMTAEPSKTDGYAVHAESIQYDAAFTQGAAALANVGDITEPIQSSFGFHIIRYTAELPEGAIPLTDAQRETMRATVLSEKQFVLEDAKFDEWFVEYDVKLYPERLAD